MKNPFPNKDISHMPAEANRAPALKEENRRLESGLTRGREVEFLLDGCPVQAFEGETVAAALLAMRKRVLRTTPRTGEPRGLYCGIGVCFDCVMTVDGQPNVRTCQMPVRAGMRVEFQLGDGAWRIET